jgi:hypothetical protein
MSAPEHSHTGTDEDADAAWSLPSPGRESSDFPVSAPSATPREVPFPTDLSDDDALAWTHNDDRQHSVFSGASPSLDGYLMHHPDGYLHDEQSSPGRLNLRLSNGPTDLNEDEYALELSEVSLEPHSLPPATPESVKGSPAEPNYLSDSQLYPSSIHRRLLSAGSARLRALPSLRRGDAGRRRKAVLERKRNSVMSHALSRGTVAPGQPSRVWRVRDGKFHQMDWKGPASLQVHPSSPVPCPFLTALSR